MERIFFTIVPFFFLERKTFQKYRIDLGYEFASIINHIHKCIYIYIYIYFSLKINNEVNDIIYISPFLE